MIYITFNMKPLPFILLPNQWVVVQHTLEQSREPLCAGANTGTV
jgi:hypothetical protein